MMREDGLITITGDGPVTEIPTHKCVHCGGHFTVVRGSRTKRGFCMKCMGTTCGAERCDPCLPFIKRLDLYEKGKLKTL